MCSFLKLGKIASADFESPWANRTSFPKEAGTNLQITMPLIITFSISRKRNTRTPEPTGHRRRPKLSSVVRASKDQRRVQDMRGEKSHC